MVAAKVRGQILVLLEREKQKDFFVQCEVASGVGGKMAVKTDSKVWFLGEWNRGSGLELG